MNVIMEVDFPQIYVKKAKR